ncbi:MAG: hypothetical protein KA155_07480 [Alphaproteobacteria bacterium]|nr:hypothetical protein [Alphaproteobacteria bacterium]
MTRILALTAAALIAAAPFAAMAEDTHAPAADAPAAEAAAPVEHTLADGTKVVVEGDAAFIVAADGTKSPAPDGEHALADGTKLTTAAGKVVPSAPAAGDAAPAEGAAH